MYCSTTYTAQLRSKFSIGSFIARDATLHVEPTRLVETVSARRSDTAGTNALFPCALESPGHKFARDALTLESRIYTDDVKIPHFTTTACPMMFRVRRSPSQDGLADWVSRTIRPELRF